MSRRRGTPQLSTALNITNSSSMWAEGLVREEGDRAREGGRFVVAAADIPAGTLLLTELPAVAGPKAGSCLVCVQCCRVLPALHQCARSAVTGTRVI